MILGQIDDSWAKGWAKKVQDERDHNGKLARQHGDSAGSIILLVIVAIIGFWLLLKCWQIFTAPLRIAKSLENLERRSR